LQAGKMAALAKKSAHYFLSIAQAASYEYFQARGTAKRLRC
jgi:hypothetical protein